MQLSHWDQLLFQMLRKKNKLCDRLETGIFATSIVQGIRLLRIKSAANKKLQVYLEPTNCNVWD